MSFHFLFTKRPTPPVLCLLFVLEWQKRMLSLRRFWEKLSAYFPSRWVSRTAWKSMFRFGSLTMLTAYCKRGIWSDFTIPPLRRTLKPPQMFCPEKEILLWGLNVSGYILCRSVGRGRLDWGIECEILWLTTWIAKSVADKSSSSPSEYCIL